MRTPLFSFALVFGAQAFRSPSHVLRWPPLAAVRTTDADDGLSDQYSALRVTELKELLRP